MRAVVALIGAWGAACAAAFQFLTRLPVPVRLEYDDALFRRSVVFYPFVGWVLGGLVAVLGGMLTALGLPPTVAAALTLCGWIALTGALHLDGLMDTADGIFSHRSRERMLEIMKDSRVGAMGVIACVLLLLIKWSLLSELLGTSGERLPSSWPLVSLAPLWSRWFMVAAIVGWPYARASQSGGLGGFFRGVGWRHAGVQTALALALSWLTICGLTAAGWISSTPGEGLRLALAFGLTAGVLGAVMSTYIARKLGGLTGDTYGAMNETIEAALLLLLWMMAVR
ncbi:MULTISPECIES: adenosylcobinamide-GDP ribazoletransferase [Paenibacillus]|uniref:Adenosylcobinamide-GDP ribazoletransferase n=2 Tax=Paenibacillus validus TaxID=44253 RepID=A0A7X2Z9K3_9BACL|nr:adenosylcobinamide-GDP ribazoletransferase [Paenibacillus validus]MUG70875.1 adenosylcobinamide-GDP ribazoletransferase [Paenibacillus validus]